MTEATTEAPAATVVRFEGGLDWQPLDIPGGTEPVSLVRLRSEPDSRALTVAVRFPDGWRRPATGYYEAAEEVVFLEGVLEIGDAAYRPGEWAYIPEGAARAGTSAAPSVLAVARFAGPARWREGLERVVTGPGLRGVLGDAGEQMASPLGSGRARLLRRGTPESSWSIEGLEPGGTSPVAAELLDPVARVWAWVPAGSILPPMDGLCFCRTFG